MAPSPDRTIVRALDSGAHWTTRNGRARVTYAFWEPGDAPPRDLKAGIDRPRSLDADERAAFEEALARFEEVANLQFVPYKGKDSAGADIRVLFADFANDAYAGFAYFPPVGEIVLNDIPALADLAPGSVGFQTLLHEIGHAVGLGHPHEGRVTLPTAEDHAGNTVMSYRDHPGTGYDVTHGGYPVAPRTLMPYDILALQAMYGAASRAHAGDDRYVYRDGIARLETLRDTGGYDIVDAGDLRLPVRIDLRPGRASSIGRFGSSQWNRPAEDNVHIARDSWIEVAIGGYGDDVLIGNARDNRLEGGAGADRLEGGEGADVLVGGAGADRLTGGAGNDLFLGTLAELDGDTLEDFTTGDRIGVLGVAPEALAISAKTTSDGVDLWLSAGGARARLHLARPVPGSWQVAPGDEGSVVFVGESLAPPTGDPGGVPPTGDGSPGDGTGSEPGGPHILGDRSDRWRGTDADEEVAGGGGHDRLFGGGGADVLDGGAGNDRLDGGPGDDVLVGGAGRDRLNGGIGGDSLDGGADADRLDGGDGNDVLRGGPGRDRLVGGVGDDVLEGGDDPDRLDGGSGDDVLVGGAGRDRLSGGTGADSLDGGADADRLDGGDGNDVLRGGPGRDRLVGGAGDDRLEPGPGGGLVDGGAGYDVLVLDGLPDGYTLRRRGGRLRILDLDPTDGDDGRLVVRGVEELLFADGTRQTIGDGGSAGGLLLHVPGAEPHPVIW